MLSPIAAERRAREGSLDDAAMAGSLAPARRRQQTAAASGMEHGDHNPHHGGVVYMYDDMHYEVVLDPNGHHRVYFTDSARQDLPASVASTVSR